MYNREKFIETIEHVVDTLSLRSVLEAIPMMWPEASDLPLKGRMRVLLIVVGHDDARAPDALRVLRDVLDEQRVQHGLVVTPTIMRHVLSEICALKAQHIEENWIDTFHVEDLIPEHDLQDNDDDNTDNDPEEEFHEPLAQAWSELARRLG